MNMYFAKFPVPVLDEKTQQLYIGLYGEDGERFVDILNSSPDEIAVISRLIAFLCKERCVKNNGFKENC